ncbi:MAG: hypothetical protein R2780_05905 [Crocinitomicaceae bacterium]
MKKSSLYLLGLIITFLSHSCSEAGTVEYVGGDEDLQENYDDSLYEEAMQDEGVMEVYAFLDGPEEYFYIAPPDNDFSIDELNMDGVSELHITPDPEYYGSKEIGDYMIGIAESNFKLNSPYDEYTGVVKVFYNTEKTIMAIEYNTKNGVPVGTCTLLEPDGDVLIEREYNSETGKYITSNREPYGAMWKLDQKNSNLIIDDKQHAFSAEGSKQVVSIMPSNYPDPDYKNSLYQVMSKETFKGQFKINGDEFTGILRAYLHPNGMEPRLYFELPFRNGWLHGDIMIYDDWGGLYLHEIFVDGELDSTVFQMEYGDGVAKPIIYLYPEKDMIVNVELAFDGSLTHTYPKYNEGWKVLAKTDGTLYDDKGKEYYALYWEGDNRKDFTINEGFVVPGNQTAEFLEKSLEIMGLSRREANEFIVYWLPQLENNAYNLIHFSTDEYEEMAKLKITPKPETLIRVMMVYEPLDTSVDIRMQDLSKLKKDRKGFTVVEWGGTKVKHHAIQ